MKSASPAVGDAHRSAQLRGARNAWSEWLQDFVWHHFVSATFRGGNTVPGAMVRVRAYIRRLERAAQRPLYAFVAYEQHASGDCHVHALVGGTAQLTAQRLEVAWDRGMVTAATYEPERGAAAYVTKDIYLGAAEHEVLGVPTAAVPAIVALNDAQSVTSMCEAAKPAFT